MQSGDKRVGERTGATDGDRLAFLSAAFRAQGPRGIPLWAGMGGRYKHHRLLTRIVQGAAGPEDLARLEVLCDMVRHTSLCGLGMTAPNPVLSTLRYFRPEYEALLQKPPS